MFDLLERPEEWIDYAVSLMNAEAEGQKERLRILKAQGKV